MYKLGDVYKIHLGNNLHSYGQYIFSSNRGPIVRIFDVLIDKDRSIQEILNTKEMFPPVAFGIEPTIKEGNWEKIGNANVDNIEPPLFRGDNKNIIEDFHGKGSPFKWYLSEPKGKIGEQIQYVIKEIDYELPDKYKTLEKEMGWSCKALNDRIKLHGKIPYPAWDY